MPSYEVILEDTIFLYVRLLNIKSNKKAKFILLTRAIVSPSLNVNFLE
jgi:hypothetical protein